MTEVLGKVLILGADGFIGRHIAFDLRKAGWSVLALARNPQRLSNMGFDVLKVDLAQSTTSDPAFWRLKLSGVTHVVNAIGVLDASHTTFQRVHVSGPATLYAALPSDAKGVLISAVGIDAKQTDFARYRLKGEEIAQRFGITPLRVGLVLADTSYGGSSLARALAVLPLRQPVVGQGNQVFNPIHANDLCRVIRHVLLMNPHQSPNLLEVGGPETITHADLQTAYRRWFGLRAVPLLRLGPRLAGGVARIGEILRLGPVSRTALRQLQSGVKAQTSPCLQALGTRGVSEFLQARPAGTQDLWHARLYLMRPVIRLVLAFLWIASGLLGLTLPATTFLPLVDTSLPDSILIAMARLGGIFDLALAIALLRHWRPQVIATLQTGLIAIYTLGFTILAPLLWLLPLGGLLKNIPILTLIALAAILDKER